MLPAVLILAAYSRNYQDVELVDDYERLVTDTAAVFGEVAHPDKFMASCITILHPRDQYPSLEAFEMIGLPGIYEELVRVEE